MLDFERFVTEDESADNYRPKYPARFQLVFLSRIRNVVPSLIEGVEQSDSEVLRANAAETLAGVVGHCEALKLLARVAKKPELPYELKRRLQAAEKQITDADPNDLMWSCDARPQ
jgi:hypothetical protein